MSADDCVVHNDGENAIVNKIRETTGEFRFHETIDTVPAGQSVDFRVVIACKY